MAQRPNLRAAVRLLVFLFFFSRGGWWIEMNEEEPLDA